MKGTRLLLFLPDTKPFALLMYNDRQMSITHSIRVTYKICYLKFEIKVLE